MKPSDHYNYTDWGEPRPIPPKKRGNLKSFLSVVSTVIFLVGLYMLLAVLFNWWPVSLWHWLF